MTDRKFQEMLDVAAVQALAKVDYPTPVSGVSFADDGSLVVAGPEGSGEYAAKLKMTPHALGQVFARLGKAVWRGVDRALPADFLTAIPADWMALNLNRAARAMPEATGWFVRSYTAEGSDAIVRGVMDRYYFPFDNEKMLEIVGEVLREKAPDHRISKQSYVNPDEMRVDVLIGEAQSRPDGGGNTAWSWGVGLRNDEIGRRSGGAYSIIKRSSCDNSIAVDMEGFNYTFRHWAKKDSLRNLRKNELYTAIANILPFGLELIERMVAADFVELPNFSEIVQGMTVVNGWSPEFVGQVWVGSEGRQTVGGIINGVTHAAQSLGDPAARFEAELIGGAILVQPDSVFSPALWALDKVRRDEQRAAEKAARAAARA